MGDPCRFFVACHFTAPQFRVKSIRGLSAVSSINEICNSDLIEIFPAAASKATLRDMATIAGGEGG